MTRFPIEHNAKRPLWQVLLAPMLLASLGLHGLFLLIPVASPNGAVIPPPDPEQDNIAITRIPPAAEEPATANEATVGSTSVPQALPQRPGQSTPSTQNRAAARIGAPSHQTAAGTATQPRASGPRSAETSSPQAASREALPALPGQGNSATSQTTARVDPAGPQVPAAEPTIPALGPDRRERILAYVASLDFSQERMDQLAATLWQRYGYSSLNTRRGEYTDNLTQWQAEIRQQTGMEALTAEEERTNFSVEMQRRACLSQPPGEVKIGYVVNPDGSFRQEPVLLRSSGYRELNQQALETIRQFGPPASEQIKAYTVTVETSVDYGPYDCLAPPQQPSETSVET